jgi:hypothetical protein
MTTTLKDRMEFNPGSAVGLTGVGFAGASIINYHTLSNIGAASQNYSGYSISQHNPRRALTNSSSATHVLEVVMTLIDDLVRPR